jgi:hypothetical protein
MATPLYRDGQVVLLNSDNQSFGVLGTPTRYVDVDDQPLFVGDVVELWFRGDEPTDPAIIVRAHVKSFVMGIENSCNDKTGDMGRWRVRKMQSFINLPIGYNMRSLTVTSK